MAVTKPVPSPEFDQLSSLRLLGDIIIKSINTLESRLAAHGSKLAFPSLDIPYNPDDETESVLLEPEMIHASELIIAAASQLIVTVRHPAKSILNDTMGFHLSACIRVAIQTNIIEILRDAGPKGLNVSEIAARAHVDPIKLVRILRLLSNHHIFRELTPNVFACNRLSSVLDSNRSPEELFNDPMKRHTSNSGISSYIEILADEGMKSSAYLTEVLTDPKTSHGTTITEAPFNTAHNTDKSLFEWLATPGREYYGARFGNAMKGTMMLEPKEAILGGFEWDALPHGSTVVDLGGGIGSSSLIVARACPSLNVVIQDRPEVIEAAKEYWTEQLPEAIETRRVQFEEQDFFAPQQHVFPTSSPTIILLRYVLHDWTDTYARKILTHQRTAASPATKLVVVDMIVPYTCDDGTLTSDIPGAEVPAAPKPLLPNMGAAVDYRYNMDLQMYVHVNGQDRTLGDFVQLAAETGWKVVRVYHIAGASTGQYECVPI